MAQRTWSAQRVPAPSVFGQMDRAKADANRKGMHIIDLSIGTSDLLPPTEALDALRCAVDDQRTYGTRITRAPLKPKRTQPVDLILFYTV
jgi:aspartate/methionine/tyrosine aminotransferase